MSLIATQPVSARATPDSAANGLIQNDGWFPDIDLNGLRGAMRLDGTVTHERLLDAAIGAIADANRQLATWQAQQQGAGHEGLAQVPGPRVNGESVKLARYRSAVYRLTNADLAERYRGFDATKSGQAEAARQEDTVEDHRREAHWALNDIVGRARSTIELL